MRGLLLKDRWSLRRDYQLCAGMMIPVMVLMIGFVAMVWTGDATVRIKAFDLGIVYFLLGTMAMSLTTGSFTHDEQCGYMQYAMITPVRRRDYVNTKLLLLLLHEGGAMLLAVGMVTAGILAGRTVPWYLALFDALRMGGIFLAVFLVVGAWAVGLHFRFPAARAKNIWLLMILAFGVPAVWMMWRLWWAWAISSFWPFPYLNYAETKLLIAVIGAAVLLAAWFLRMSYVWMKRKEF